MIFLYILLGLVLFLALILSLRGTVAIAYDGELSLSVRVLFVKINILPKKDKRKKVHSMSKKKSEKLRERLEKKKEKKRQAKLEKKRAKEEKKKNAKKKTISEILTGVTEIVELVKLIAGKFFGHLKIKVVRFNIKVASDDAATTAIAYGAINSVIATLYPFIESSKNIKTPNKKNFNIYTDFLSETPEADVKILLSIRVWQIVDLGIAAVIKLVKNKLKKQKINENKTAKKV